MGSLQDLETDIYLRNNELFYDLSTPMMPPPGMLVPSFTHNSLSYDSHSVPNNFNYGVAGYYEDVFDYTMKLEEPSYGGFKPSLRTINTSTLCPLDHQINNLPIDDWGYKVHDQGAPAMEEPSMKVGKYSAEERKDRIIRYLKKRTQRNFSKTIKYACRKTLADKRVRVRGRFARNNELLCGGGDKEEKTMNNHSDNSHAEREVYDADIIKIKHDEEEWLQEAMAGLMYFPYVSG